MNNAGFFPNVLHSDKWKITFSNIPTLQDTSDMRYFDNYVKSCVLPPYTMGEILSQLPMGMQIRHPLGGMKRNQELGTLNMTFKLSEDMYNYYILYQWIHDLRYGDLSPDHEDLFRKYTIKRLVLSMLDNQKRTVSEITFTNVFLSELGSLNLNFGSTDELSFDCVFSYEEFTHKMKNPTIGGAAIDTPVNISECGTSGISNTPILDWERR